MSCELHLNLHLHNLFAKSYKDMHLANSSAKIKISKQICAAKVINNFGTNNTYEISVATYFCI